MKTKGLQRWLYAGGGLVVGVGLGMTFGLLWAKDHAAWVQAIGTVVAAIGASIAAVAAVLAFRHEREVRDQEVARLRAEVEDREKVRAEDRLKDAQNVLVTCRPAGSGSRGSDGKIAMSGFQASWDVNSSVPALDVRMQIPPYIPHWQGIADAIPVGSKSKFMNFNSTNAYEIENSPASTRQFEYSAVVRFTLAGQRWERKGKGDPVPVTKEQD